VYLCLYIFNTDAKSSVAYVSFFCFLFRFQIFCQSNPHRAPEDVAFVVARFFRKVAVFLIIMW
jgi:hypothetical protein